MLGLQKKLAYLILGMKGGENRIQIINALNERPYNINQLSQILDLNYRTIKHHVNILHKNEIVSTSKAGGYGDVYFLSPKMEGIFNEFQELVTKYENSKKLSEFAKSRKYYQDIVEQSHDAIIIIGIDDRIYYWNNGAEKLFGYKSEKVLWQINPIIPDENRKDFDKVIEKVVKGNDLTDHETRWKNKNNKLIDVNSTLSPIFDKEKNLLGISIISRDISERIKQSQEIEKEREKFKQFFENEPEYCYMISTKGDIIDVNKSALKTLEYKKSDLIGKNLNIIYPPNSIKLMNKLFEKWKNTGKLINEEIEIISKKGNIRTVLLSASSIKSIDGKISHSVSVQRDITKLKQAEDALKRSRERYSLAQKAANIGSWDWNIKTDELKWSDTIEPMFGFKKGQFKATFNAFIKSVHPDDRNFLQKAVKKCIEKNSDYDIEHRIIWPDESIRWVSETGDVIRDKKGKAVRMLGIVKDITEHKLADEELKRNKQMLDDIVSGIGAGLNLIDMDRKIIWANKTYIDLFGPIEEIRGKHCYAVYWGNDKPCKNCLCGYVEKTGKMKQESQTRITKDGEKKEFFIASTPIKDSSGKVVQILELILPKEKTVKWF